ncbi:MAG: hypothetical protein HFJ11_01110 [Bacilli bacterium]|nr:hypothetical protein [Bacilli bacterium]
MNNSYNKKEIKSECRNFKMIASRVLTSEYDTFDSNLKRLIKYIDSTENIKKYIESCINGKDDFNIEEDVKQVSNGYGQYIFDSPIDENEEVSYTYQILKYITDNDVSFRGYTFGYSTSKEYNDKVQGFNDKFILPFINEIEGNYERICIEMGLDDNNNYFITNNGGQVNIAKDESTINATQNNYSEIDKLINKVKNNIDSIDDSNLKNEIIDNIEGLQEEIKKEKPKKGIINAITSSLKSILPEIPKAIELTAAITEIISFVSTLQ